MDLNHSSAGKSLGEAYVAALRATGALDGVFEATRWGSSSLLNMLNKNVSQIVSPTLLKNALAWISHEQSMRQNVLSLSSAYQELSVVDPTVVSRLRDMIVAFSKSLPAHKPKDEAPIGPQISALIAEGTALERRLSPEELDMLLDDAENSEETRLSLGEWWHSLTDRQQHLVKLGTLGLLFVSILVSVFMAQTEYPGFGQFLASSAIPAGLALFATSKVSPYLMNTRTHPISKKITRR
ncbi:hypothetical protein FQ154_09605 [Paeniglutamicibacter gangotriensis]|uniref:Uncharacterized protein n=1 Tax=Paeniglutamicibacter gangotriensis TaxID=254787 RepID=A0A5B0EDL6_9MICC|nr:hypothetical protein [Paeniglutamicibacter gangotriensis]KAA0977144.1 hypothetical protein FQ154_09605 [Paeniglutamicibacter gangotriensis]